MSPCKWVFLNMTAPESYDSMSYLSDVLTQPDA